MVLAAEQTQYRVDIVWRETRRERQRDNTVTDYHFRLHLNQRLQLNKAIYRSGFGAALKIM